ncbi:Auxilin-like protein 1 [Hirschfeldia incana]|nr:Auxilin-like protein 1 [Hirschfeldia incana]
MEYEKPPTATAFSRKMTNRSHSHSLSFSANAVYDGVFSSPSSNAKSPLVDYGEIFRSGSGPSPSSIPFLDVPELNVAKVKVDVRSSKLDYSSVFGGFGACDFAVTPNEVVIVRPEMRGGSREKERRNRRKGGSSSDEVKNVTSSPEMVRMKHSDILLHHTKENGTTVPSPSPTQLVGEVNPLQKIGLGSESGTTRSGHVPVVVAPSTQVVDNVSSPLQKIVQGNEKGAQVPVVAAPPTQVVDNTSLLQKVESKAPIPSVEKKPCDEGVEEVQASKKRRSKTEVDFDKIFVRDECKTDSIAERRDVKPPSSLLQRTLNGENGASDRFIGFSSGLPEKFYQDEDDDSPSSPPFFDAETDLDSSAAESSAALKKALEEAQVRMNIAKQMMDRKKSGFRSSAKLKSSDEYPKVEVKTEAVVCSQVEDKRSEKVEGKIEESRDNSPQVLGELVNSSEQTFSNEGDQHAKRARKQWEVPEGLLNSTSDHKQQEVEEEEAVKLEEEQARKARKHWDLPGGIFKSVMNSKKHEPESLAPDKPQTDSKQEVQPSTENPFYSFGQLGSKIKGVVEAFTGSKVSQKDETHAAEEEKSTLPQMVHYEEGDSQEMLAGVAVMETNVREAEEIQQQTESQGETKQEEKSDSKMSTLADECSEKKEKETGWQVKTSCDSEDGPECGVIVFQENPDPTYSSLDQEDEKEIVSGPQEMFVPDDTKPYVREVEEIQTPNESLSTTQLDESVGTMVSFATENTPEPGNIHEETEQKAPRRRRVWKTSEDVYNMIRAPKGNKRHWQLPSVETETTQRSFQMEGVRIHDTSEETESTSEQAGDSGLQENWTVLKQMFRQMFQTADTTKGEDETYCLVESEKDHIDIHQKAGDENGKETSYCQITGTDRYEQNEVETEYNTSADTTENEELESAQEKNCREDEGKVEVQGKTSLVRELIGEEPDATGMASDQEGPEVFEEAGWAQGVSELDENREHPDSRAEMLEYDRSETDSNKSCEKFDQTRELAEETKNDCTDTSRSSFETRQSDSHTEEVGFEQDLRDQFHEKNSAASSTEEHVEEIDSDSIQSGWSVVDDEDRIKSYVEESLVGHLQYGGASKVEEIEETKEESDDTKRSVGEENNEDKTEQEDLFECQKEEVDGNNVEPAEPSCSLPKGDEKIDAATDINMKENEGEVSSRSSLEEEGDATSDASQKEAERVEKHLKKKDEAKEKERERSMVERAIREARERAFADAKERAGKAAMEKAKARAPRRVASDGPRRSEKASVEVNDKLSSAEKASMQAKLRAERAAVERALSEARERALEKALSGKFDASQTKSYGGSKSFGSSGDRRGSSSSGTENKSSGPSSSSNQTAKGEPIQRCKARSERHQRTSERAAEALAEKKLRDLKVQKEEAERNRLAEALDADVKRWSNGKENNLRALLSTLQYILGAESGWKPIPLTDLVSSASVRKAYRKATLYVHPDKLQQRGASTQQKYICEKVFDLLKEAWNKFGADER